MVSRTPPFTPPVQPDPEELLTIRNVQGMIKLAPRTIQLRVKAKTFPAPCVRRVKFVRWRRQDVVDWIEAQKRLSIF